MFERSNARQVTHRGVSNLLGLLSPYKSQWALATLALVVASGVGLIIPQGVRLAVDEALSKGSTSGLAEWAWLGGAAFLALGVLTFLRTYLTGFLGHRIVADLRIQSFQRLLRHPPGFFQERKSGEFISRLTSDIQMLHFAVGTELSVAVKGALDLAGGLTLLFLTSSSLSLVMLLTIPPLAVGAVWVGRRVRGESRKLQDEVAQANSRLKEAVVGIETVQAFRAESDELGRYESGILGAFRSAMRLTLVRAGFYAITQFGFYASITVICFYGASEVLDGALSTGELIGFMLYTAFIGSALMTLAQLWGNLQSALGASERIFELLDETPTISNAKDAQELHDPQGELAFEDIHFAYPTRSDVAVLQGVNLTIKRGQTVALVGPSGAGKTTMTALLLRFYDPQQGRVLFDGFDLRSLTLDSLRGAMATVSQEAMLFSGSIEENIRYGFPEASDDRVEEVMKLANVHEFSDDLPDGRTTLVGERGVKLSGGQRQRIAIARALLADPQLLILDEATSHLDTENEALVQEALEHLMADRTTLIVAHRLSTVKNADLIVVLSEGQIVQSGTHDELIATDGIYNQLTRRQFQ